MAFGIPQLRSYDSLKSTDGQVGMSALPYFDTKMKSRLLAQKYLGDKAVNAAKLGYQAQLDAFQPKETSWGSVFGSALGTLGDAGIFDNIGLSGTDKMVARDNAMYGNTFPKGSFGTGSAGGVGKSANDLNRHLSSGSDSNWWNNEYNLHKLFSW